MARLVGLGVIVAGVGLATPVQAQEWRIDASASLAAAAVEDDSTLGPAGDGLLFDAGVVITRKDVLENGLSLTWRFEGRAQRDAPSRPAFAGVLGACDPAVAGCPSVANGSGFLAPVSPAAGLATFGQPLDEDIFASLEGASLSVAGPWGEGIFGVDSGVAAILDARAPAVLARVSALSPSLDPTGVSLSHTRNDAAGPALKASYMTPRILGFRLGASFTPEPAERGVDFDPSPGVPGAQAELRNIFESAVSFARTDRSSGVRLRAALTGTWADSDGPFVEFGAYSAIGAGLEVERGEWSFGLRWLKSDNAWRANGKDYSSVDLGLVRQGERWRFGVEVSHTQNDLGRQEGFSWLAGASRKLGENLNLGLAWIDSEGDFPVSSAAGWRHTNVANRGLVIELTVHK